jgi:hypothetical protein
MRQIAVVVRWGEDLRPWFNEEKGAEGDILQGVLE